MRHNDDLDVLSTTLNAVRSARSYGVDNVEFAVGEMFDHEEVPANTLRIWVDTENVQCVQLLWHGNIVVFARSDSVKWEKWFDLSNLVINTVITLFGCDADSLLRPAIDYLLAEQRKISAIKLARRSLIIRGLKDAKEYVDDIIEAEQGDELKEAMLASCIDFFEDNGRYIYHYHQYDPELLRRVRNVCLWETSDPDYDAPLMSYEEATEAARKLINRFVQKNIGKMCYFGRVGSAL